MRRTSLFNRRFATLSRKEALVRTAPQDAEGFDDLDQYFAATSPPRAPEPRSWESPNDEKSRENGRKDSAMSMAAGMEVGDIRENLTTEDDRENVIMADDNEVSFRPTMKLVKSSPSVHEKLRSEATLEASIQDYIEPDYMQDDPEPIDPEPINPEQTNSRQIDLGPVHVQSKSTKKTPSSRKPKVTEARTGPKESRPKEPKTGLKKSSSREAIMYDENGRKSKRQKIPPLAYWKNEKVVYGRRQSSRLPVIVDVVRADGEESPIKKSSRTRSRTTSRRQMVEKLQNAGFKAKVSVTAKVMDYDNHRETERRKLWRFF
jgi:hypothetical protein